MFVDELQEITDAYVKSENNSLDPQPIWRPFIEHVFKDIVDLDLDKKDKILVINPGFLKELALFLSTHDDEMLGEFIIIII